MAGTNNMTFNFNSITLASMREKLENVTPGPWVADTYGGQIWAKNPYGYDLMHIADIRGWGHLTGSGACAMKEKDAQVIQDANQEFIAYARDMYPRMLNEIDRLLPFEEECRALRAQIDQLTHEKDKMAQSISSAESYLYGCQDIYTAKHMALRALDGISEDEESEE